ncbi:hypothetical protein TPE_1012 [Treponema pedis str. T A4]|uniref:Uncharacterized protein n=1 Tax=Treponema pedis str. T A4 TaxID=1291379 RepID=S5ZZ59_9SPIR|nr:hypothetical protein TPE_1012 [Treponema pedis str. T A4]
MPCRTVPLKINLRFLHDEQFFSVRFNVRKCGILSLKENCVILILLWKKDI